MMKIDAKSLVEKARPGESTVVSALHVDESPRRRGRPLKKQINVMFQVLYQNDNQLESYLSLRKGEFHLFF